MRIIFLFTMLFVVCSMVAFGETDPSQSQPDSKAAKNAEVTTKTVAEKKVETEKAAKEENTAEGKKAVEAKEVGKKGKEVQETKADAKKAPKAGKQAVKADSKKEGPVKKSKAESKSAEPVKKEESQSTKAPAKDAKKSAKPDKKAEAKAEEKSDKPAEKAVVKKTEKRAEAKADVKMEKGKKPAGKVAQKTESSGIDVARAVICKGVANREPQGIAKKFKKNVNRLYCFSHIKGVRDTLKIMHKWYYKDNEVGFTNLKVKSSNWRTNSYRNIAASQTGPWKVEIVNVDNGDVLASVDFAIE